MLISSGVRYYVAFLGLISVIPIMSGFIDDILAGNSCLLLLKPIDICVHACKSLRVLGAKAGI